jgi:hypothetical protein
MVVSIAGTNSFASAWQHHNAFAQMVVSSEFAAKAAANSRASFARLEKYDTNKK